VPKEKLHKNQRKKFPGCNHVVKSSYKLTSVDPSRPNNRSSGYFELVACQMFLHPSEQFGVSLQFLLPLGFGITHALERVSKKFSANCNKL
jgi:hypothetical protein